MPYARIETSGCGIHKNRIKLRLDLFLQADEPNYDKTRHYVVDTTSKEYQRGYKGKLNEDGSPVDEQDYQQWLDSLPHVWIDTPFHTHFIYPSKDASDTEVKAEIQRCLEYFYTFHQYCWTNNFKFIDEWRKVPSKTGEVRQPFVKGNVEDLPACQAKVQDVLSRPQDFGITVSQVQSQDLNIGEKGTIDIGPGAINRPSGTSAATTHIDRGNPANGTGVIDTFEVWASVTIPSSKFGTFYGSGTDYTNRDYEVIGEIVSGAKRQFTGLSIEVSTGDYAGFRGSSGNIEISLSGQSGYYYKSGDQFDAGTQTYSLSSDNAQSIYGTGTEGGGGVEVTPDPASAIAQVVAPTVIVPPTAIQQAATNIGNTVARINGKISDDGGATCEARFRWGERAVSTETLRPNAAGDETNIPTQYPDSGYHWQKVDEASPDDNNSYVEQDSLAWDRDLYNLPPHSGSGTINKVTLYFRVLAAGSLAKVKGVIKSNSTVTETTQKDPYGDFGSLTWGTYSQEWAVNPADSEPWEWSDIDALQIGVALYCQNTRCTQIYIEVNYTSEPEEWTTTEWQNTLETDSEYHEDLTELDPGTEYEFQTQAKNEAGEGEWSESAYFETVTLLLLSLTEGLKTGDTPSQLMTAGLSVTEGLKGGESFSQLMSADLITTDGGKLGETLAQLMTALPTLTEGVKLSEVLARAMDATITLTDDLNVAETLNLAAMLTAADGIELGDSAAQLYDLLPSLIEGVQLGETLTRLMQASPSVTDGVTFSDSLLLELTGLVYFLTLTDAFKLGDTGLVTMSADLSASDGFKLGEVLEVLNTTSVTITDGVSFADVPVIALVSGIYLTLLDAMSLGDTPAATMLAGITLTDGTKLGDSPVVNILASLLKTEGVAFGEAYNITLTSALYYLTLSEGISVSDAEALSAAMELTLSDGTKIGEILIREIVGLQVSLTEGFKLGDAGSLAAAMTILLTEGIKLGDLVYPTSLGKLLKMLLYIKTYHDLKLLTKTYHDVKIWTGDNAMTIRRDWQRGETVPIWAEVRLETTGALYDPDQGVVLTVTNPSGTAVITAQAMSPYSTGIYVYYWNSEANSVAGWYRAKGTAQDGTGATAKVTIENGGFHLQE